MIVAAALIALVAVASVPASAWVVTNNAIHPPHKAVGDAPVGAKEVTLDGAEGAAIAAWYLPPQRYAPMCPAGVVCTPPPSAVPGVVILHGISSSREFMRDRIALFSDAGFAVLAIDLRGQGESTGENTLGELESQDALTAADWLAQQPGVDGTAIALDGSSFGGMVALVAAAADPDIVAVVAESPSTNAENAAGGGWLGDFGMWLHGIDGSEVDSVKAAALLAGRPVMVVVGEQESSANAETIVAASGGELWIAPGGHTEAPEIAPHEYALRVVGFVSQAVN